MVTTEGLFGKAVLAELTGPQFQVSPNGLLSQGKTLNISDQLPDWQSQSGMTCPLLRVPE